MKNDPMRPAEYKRKRANGVEVIPRATRALVNTLDLALQNADKRCVYPDTEAGRKQFESDALEYLRTVASLNAQLLEKGTESKPILPSIEGMAAYLHMSRTTIFMYSKRDDEWRELIDRLKTIMYSARSQAASDGSMPPMIFVFDSVNNFQYNDVKEFHLTEGEPEKPRMTADEIRQRIGLLDNVTEE